MMLPSAQAGEQSTHSIDYLFTSEPAGPVQKCACIVRNVDAAENLAQETLLKA